MRKTLRSALAVATTFVASVLAAQDDCNIHLRDTILLANVPNRIIVEPLLKSIALRTLIDNDPLIRRSWKATPVGSDGAVRIDSESLTSEQLRDLFTSPLYVRIAKDPYIRAHGHCRRVPTDGIFHNKDDLQWWFDKIHAPEAWTYGQGDRSVIAAVVDSGIKSDHSDLQENVFTAHCDFTVKVDGRDVTCRKGEFGYDAIADDCNSSARSNHGTEVAGIIGAVANNGGVVGVNWAVTMLSVTAIDEGDGGCASRAIKGLQFVRQFHEHQHAVRVVNLSWGMEAPSEDLEKELKQLAKDDIVIVVSAGNDGHDNDRFPMYPASYTSIPTLIAVGSTTRHRFMFGDSNYGRSSVLITAPGQDIRTTGSDRDFPFFSHTSAAAPFVTGAIALLASQCPKMSGKELRDLVLNNSDTLMRLRFRKHVSGGRYLNLQKASEACEVWKQSRKAV